MRYWPENRSCSYVTARAGRFLEVIRDGANCPAAARNEGGQLRALLSASCASYSTWLAEDFDVEPRWNSEQWQKDHRRR